MRTRLLAFLIICTFILSCRSKNNAEELNLSLNENFEKFLTDELSIAEDTSRFVNQEVIINYFDSIPKYFAEVLIEEFGTNGIEEEYRDFIVSYPVDSIDFLSIARTNMRLDPFGKYSDSTYYLMIGYYSSEIPMGLTWLIDFKRKIISSWRYPFEDSLKYIYQTKFQEIPIDSGFVNLMNGL
jgi:hypothetical protein